MANGQSQAYLFVGKSFREGVQRGYVISGGVLEAVRL